MSLPAKPEFRLRYRLLIFAVARTVLNTGHRMVYPFLPTLARGVGVNLDTMALAVTGRSALGLVGPLFGSLADWRGRKLAMIAGLLLFAVSMLLVTLWPTYPGLFLALVLASAAKLTFDPALQAFIGDHVHYTQRGLAIAITEVSWSAAFLLGMPLIGWLIARTGTWRAPFPFLSLFAVAAALLVWQTIPSDRAAHTVRPSLAQGLHIIASHPAARAGLSVSLLISAANEIVGIVYGAWMEDAFGLEIAALGAASAIIGLAELGGEGMVGGLTDRLGKRRAVSIGLVLSALTCILLPALGFGVVGALVGLFLFFITFEFTLVSSLPLMTEMVPQARATLMAGNAALLSGGRMIGALAGPVLFDLGLSANGLVAALLNLTAWAILVMYIPKD